MSSATGPAGENSPETPAEYVAEKFDTNVPDGAIEDVAGVIESIIDDLRNRVASDDRLEALLRGQPGRDQLHGSDITERGDPEPFTQRRIIEPLFDELGYPDFTTEASGLTDEQRQKADYLFSLREYDAIDSGRLPVEAEPLNKKLDQQRHGLGQVKDWLDTYSFDAEFGIATDGMRWILIKHDRERYGYDTLAEINLQPVFIAAFENLTGRGMSFDEWGSETTTTLLERFIRAFGFENFVAIASEAKKTIDGSKSAATAEFYEQYVRRVFGVLKEGEDERTTFSLVEDGIDPPETATGDDERLFAVELMNRLIFIKFLEDRGLVPPDLLSNLAETYNPKTYPRSLYETYFEPLFFGVLNERPSERTEQIRNVGFYSEVPYLNGGLFRPHENTERGFTDRAFDVRDAVMTSIIEFLEAYTFSADGSPDDLDPSILGNVFEKTINYLTGDPGDSKKQLGAYYTPDEITRFCAEGTVQPWLLERFKDTMAEDLGRERVDMDRYDDLFALIERAVPQDANVVEALLADVDDLRALDPACGSGHFLTSVLGEIVTVRKALYEKHPEDPQSWEIHKQTVVKNIYGVDIVEPAVEIAKLRLWLSIIAEVDAEEVEGYDEGELALPNVVFNIRQGNSLIGFTDLMETKGEENDDGSQQAALTSWGPDSVRAKYGNIISLVAKHKRTTGSDEAVAYLREAEALLEEYRVDLNEKMVDEFHEAGIGDATLDQVRTHEPFHWVLEFAEAYADGGFDVVIGNPPWDVITVDRNHFFPRYDGRFRTRPPKEKNEVQERLLDNPKINTEWQEFQRNMELKAKYYNGTDQYLLQNPTVGGQTVATENEMSLFFFERATQLAGDNSYVSQVIPGSFFLGATGKDLRQYLIDKTSLEHFVQFQNKQIFEGLHNSYRFAICTFKNSGSTDTIRGGYRIGDLSILNSFSEQSIDVPVEVLKNYSPESRIFPYLRSQELVDSLSKIVQHPSIGERVSGAWFASLYMKELDRATDADRLVEISEEGDYPIYEGKNIHQFAYDNEIEEDLSSISLWGVAEDEPERSAKHRTRMKNFRSRDPNTSLKKSIYNEFGGSGSQKAFVNDLLQQHGRPELSKEDVLLDCTEYRIGIRNIARADDERTLIASVLPKDVVTVHTICTIRPYLVDPSEDDLSKYPMHDAYERAFTDRELFALLGLLNSVPFDHLMRTKVDSHIVQYKFNESQMPRLTDGDDWFHYIAERAARLNCYGDAFAEMRDRLGGLNPATEPGERERLRAEIDAAAFHAYGLDHEETAFILDDFHRVRSPRLMTENYFERVLEEYDSLAESGPYE